MSLRQHILPFKLEITDDLERVTGRAALPLVVEVIRFVLRPRYYRALAKALGYKSRKTVRRHVESLILLMTDGGEHLDDLHHLRADAVLPEVLGYRLSSPSQAKDFLYRFHQAADGSPLEREDDQRLSVKRQATIREEGPGLCALAKMVDAVVAAVQRFDPQWSATIDVDATIIEAHKILALKAYEGTIGYQPQGALWSEHNIWVGDEFRDGNVPAQFKILAFVKRVFACLPKGIRRRRLRGDSALYDEDLLTWLDDERIEFAVSADMSQSLRATITRLDEQEWKPYEGNNEQANQREERQWAEVVFVPDWKRNRRKDGQPLRYIAIRVRSRQRELYEDDEGQWRHFAVVTNLDAEQWSGGRVLRWHRKKQGTVEQANGVVKNDLGGGVLPCGRFGSNAAWWRLNMLAQNLLELLKLLLPGDLELARPKTLRFRLFRMAGRLVRHARRWVLRISSAHPLARAYERARRTLARWLEEVLAEEVVAG